MDLATIDSLADAINAFNGGVVVVSHDFRLLDKVAKDILLLKTRMLQDGTVLFWITKIIGFKGCIIVVLFIIIIIIIFIFIHCSLLIEFLGNKHIIDSCLKLSIKYKKKSNDDSK